MVPSISKPKPAIVVAGLFVGGQAPRTWAVCRRAVGIAVADLSGFSFEQMATLRSLLYLSRRTLRQSPPAGRRWRAVVVGVEQRQAVGLEAGRDGVVGQR